MKSHKLAKDSSKGKLIIVPAPIAELGKVSSMTLEALLKAHETQSVIAVEDLKPARQRWRAWDLPREAIDKFIPYNEHTREGRNSENETQYLLDQLLLGKDVYLLSDGGTPGFCDPGRSLVAECHRKGIVVTLTSADNSLIPAIALSGFTEGAFKFLGFPPREKEKRREWFVSLTKESMTTAFMDTPYRLNRVISELIESFGSDSTKKYIYFLCDINRDSERSFWGSVEELKKIGSVEKGEFIAVLAGKSNF